jgi:hypothetical protein
MPPFERVSDLRFSVRVEGQENRAAGITGRSSRRGSFALFGFQFSRELEESKEAAWVPLSSAFELSLAESHRNGAG